MWVVHFLGKLPDIAVGVGFRGKVKFRFCNQVDHFVSGKKLAWVEVYPPASPPNNDLSDRKAFDNIVPIL